jgi:hypothetical protein
MIIKFTFKTKINLLAQILLNHSLIYFVCNYFFKCLMFIFRSENRIDKIKNIKIPQVIIGVKLNKSMSMVYL